MIPEHPATASPFPFTLCFSLTVQTSGDKNAYLAVSYNRLLWYIWTVYCLHIACVLMHLKGHKVTLRVTLLSLLVLFIFQIKSADALYL